MTIIQELQEKRTGLLAKSEAIRLKYAGKQETMTAQEESEWANILDDVDRLQRTIENCQKEEAIAEWGKVAANRLPKPGIKGMPGVEDSVVAAGDAAFRKFLKGGDRAMTEADLKAIAATTSSKVYTKAYQADDPSGGGFLVTPQAMAQLFITLMKDIVYIRAAATVIPLNNADSLGIGAIDTDPSDDDWTTELGTGNEETTMKFGKRELRPSPVAKRLKLSKKLIRNAAMPVESIVMDRMSYKFGITEEKAFIKGTGFNQPLGVYTVAADGSGIPTTRDVTAASATVIAADDLIETKYKLKVQYRNNAKWLLHRDVVKACRKLKDSNNNYIWTTSGAVSGPGGGLQGTPDTLLNVPIMESEYSPNTFTTGLYLAIIGDFSRYVIADALDMEIQVLNELYAETNQIGYIMRKETDGMPTLAEAFSRLKLA